MRNKQIIAVVALIAVLFGAGVVNAAPGGFWDKVAEVVGLKIAEKVQVPDLSVSLGSEELGTAGDVYRSPKMQEVILTSQAVTTTIQNTDTNNRIIDRITYYAGSIDSTLAGSAVTFAFATSSNGVVATDIISSGHAFSTSTNVYMATSTFNIDERNWPANSYLMVYLSAAVTTTEGFFKVDYSIAD